MTRPMIDFEPYMTVPFVEHGRSRSGWDCWGLVLVILKEMAGVVVPDYPASPSDAPEVARMFRGGLGEADVWLPIDAADVRPFDVAVMHATCTVDGRVRRLPLHAGLYLSKDVVLHSEARTGTMAIPARGPDMARRFVCARRFAGLA